MKLNSVARKTISVTGSAAPMLLMKASLVEKSADCCCHSGPGDEERSDLGVHCQVGIPLTVTLLGIGETAPAALKREFARRVPRDPDRG